jgi:hypothetical protein
VQNPFALATVLVVAFAACAGDAVSPTLTTSPSGSVGTVSANVSGSSVTAAGGATGAEYTLVAFNGSASASSRSSVTVTPTGIGTLTASTSLVASTGRSASGRS